MFYENSTSFSYSSLGLIALLFTLVSNKSIGAMNCKDLFDTPEINRYKDESNFLYESKINGLTIKGDLNWFTTLQKISEQINVSERVFAIKYPKETLELIPEIIGTVTVKNLETISEGAYRINNFSVELLKNSNNFSNSSGELGLFYVMEQWVLIVSKKETTKPHYVISALIDYNAKIDLHTHPGKDPYSEYPSRSDLNLSFWDSKIRNKAYIANHKDLIILHRPQMSNKNSDDLWKEWLKQNISSIEEFHNIGPWPVFEMFLKDVYSLQRIPWKKIESIEDFIVE